MKVEKLKKIKKQHKHVIFKEEPVVYEYKHQITPTVPPQS